MRDWPLRSDMIRTLGAKGPIEGKAMIQVRKDETQQEVVGQKHHGGIDTKALQTYRHRGQG